MQHQIPRLVICACLLPVTAHAQSGTGLELQTTVLELTGQVLEWSLPATATGAAGQDLGIRETRNELHIELPADILFDFDKYTIRPSAAAALRQAANLIRTASTGPVRIEGHTDAKGGAPYNQRLSQRRADAVRTWLVQKEGLKSVQFNTAGFGSRRPVAPNTKPDGSDDPAGRQRNRRVELVLQRR
jgi:outer membrane protein OmpA-like peptidoglycan-associated protein